jgi:glutathione synthase/RimK-type ligase-like ATP-grasp enzyme
VKIISVLKVKITYVDYPDVSTCYLTNEQLRYFDLSNSKEYIYLTIGSVTIHLKKVILSSNEIDSGRLHLSRDIETPLHIMQGTVLQMKKVGDEHLELGPFIGVFINQEKINLLERGKSIVDYEQYNIACKYLYGLCCFFSIENIDWNRRLIKGLVKKNSKWIYKTLPIPKVIYDRNVENNCRVESIELRKRLADKHVIINSIPKLAKWETINTLSKNPALISMMPKTTLYKSWEDIESSLIKYSSIYLKPDALSKGKGIFKISKKNEGQYRVEYRSTEENHVVSLRNLNDLNRLMEKYMDKGCGYIIQQEINKALFRDNPFDFRFLFQKDYTGDWQPSGAAGRIAAPNSIITSPRSGGKVNELSTILKESFNEDIYTEGGQYEKIVYYGIEICKEIEKEFGNCVELGLDMTIDINGKIWIIEVNGKPLKVSLKRLNNPEVVARCNRRPLEYAVYLSGFKAVDTKSGGLLNYNISGG